MSVFKNSSISTEFHIDYILVGDLHYVIMEFGIGYARRGIELTGFVVKQVNVL